VGSPRVKRCRGLTPSQVLDTYSQHFQEGKGWKHYANNSKQARQFLSTLVLRRDKVLLLLLAFMGLPSAVNTRRCVLDCCCSRRPPWGLVLPYNNRVAGKKNMSAEADA
jgi:hypothetical protein